ncbi:arginase 1, mitochondrial-like [Gastrolobium bilobum]|uniref:arginase 1, mitochondrial-like n=1 Tax=Gastrolobium bilobum TaxID=150636 RepID=UPI002AB1FE78|nr:arginase 1, mitochondrial-like [Gastrolobium bilobum]
MSILYSLARTQEMSRIGRRGYHCMQKLYTEKISRDSLDTAQHRVIDASLTLIRERAKLKGELVRALGGATATSTLLGVPLGHNSSFLQGRPFASPFSKEAICCGCSNLTEEGKDLHDVRVLTDVGDVLIQAIRECGVDDDRMMNVVTESVKIVMEQRPLRPLVLGGDHSVSYPVVRAVSEKLGGPVDILHLDAHPDHYSRFPSFARIKKEGYAGRIVQVGVRSKPSEGREQGHVFVVDQCDMRTISRDCLVLELLKLGMGIGVKGLYVAIDVDCLHPAFAPGVCRDESGGLSFQDVLNILQNLQGDIVGGDVVEYNPQHDTASGNAMVTAKVVKELAARMSK